jgi:hypothetical protein
MLQEIVNNFFPEETIFEVKPFGHGHINDTYKLTLANEKGHFILQRINTDVFRNPLGIAQTHLKLQQIIGSGEQEYSIARILPTKTQGILYTDKVGNAWRMTNFISDSYTIEVVKHGWEAYQAGLAFGWFVKVCSKLDASDFPEAIKDFHKLSFRLQQLDQAISENKSGRLDSVLYLVEFYKKREDSLMVIEKLVETGEIPLRIVHNDTKINNLLFRGQSAAAVIDLDTVGPGILYYDYGDALRTSGNTAAEDEKDLNKVDFNMNAFESFTKGFINQVKTIITPGEVEYFYKAPVLLTFIMGIRFLADYINGDTYYKTTYADHNLSRSLVQKKLIESMESRENQMKEIIKKALHQEKFITV